MNQKKAIFLKTIRENQAANQQMITTLPMADSKLHNMIDRHKAVLKQTLYRLKQLLIIKSSPQRLDGIMLRILEVGPKMTDEYVSRKEGKRDPT